MTPYALLVSVNPEHDPQFSFTYTNDTLATYLLGSIPGVIFGSGSTGRNVW